MNHNETCNGDEALRGVRAAWPSDWTAQVTSAAIVHLDRDGVVVGWNTGAERLQGYRRDEVVGTSFTRLYRAEERDQGKPTLLLRLAAAQGSIEDTGWRVRSDGSSFWAHVVLTAVHNDATGEVMGFVKIVTDLSADRARRDADRSFLRAFTHDFLSPMTALQGYVDLLREGDRPHDPRLDRVAVVVEHLTTMVGELATRVKSQGASVEMTTVSLGAVVADAADIVLPGDAYRRVSIAGDADLTAVIDAVAVRRAVANVLDNAAKYSDHGIRVLISSINGRPSISVTDHGRGIDPGDLDQIFSPLFRGRLADPSDGGSGIGLSSVKTLIESQGGSVTVQSVLREGTTVTISLPVVAGNHVEISSTSTEDGPATAEPIAKVHALRKTIERLLAS